MTQIRGEVCDKSVGAIHLMIAGGKDSEGIGGPQGQAVRG